MRLNEIATQVKIIDGERNYYYWVTQSRPEKAQKAALKKHRDLMGLGSAELGNKGLTVTVVGHSTHDMSPI